MTVRWLGPLGVALGLCVAPAPAADVVWRPVTPGPAVTLGAPVAIGTPATPVAPISYDAGRDRPRVVRAQAAEPPPPAPPPVSAPPPAPPPVYTPPPPAELYNHGVVAEPVPSGGPTFWDKCKELFDFRRGPLGSSGRCAFQSDHCFDGYISPVSNPFLLQDPRSLTELRPIFLFQSIPNDNYALNGGDIEFFGVQARLALTERLSFVLSKLGGIWVNSGDGALPGYEGGSGFAEVNLGPQYTLLRNERSGTLGAFGVTFQIPTGAKSTFQDTGSLSVVPYLTLAQTFGRSSYGSFNVLGTVGYAFGTDNQRSDSFFTGLHLDYDVGNLHKFYPLIELNWTHFTSNGSVRVQDFEGGDLINFGATNVSGNDNLSLALGARYKFSEQVQFGTAVEFPVVGRKDLMDFRWTVDFIFRY